MKTVIKIIVNNLITVIISITYCRPINNVFSFIVAEFTSEWNKRKIKLINLQTILPFEIKVPAKYVLFLRIQKDILALPIASNIKESELVMKKNPSVMRYLPKFKGLAVSSSGRVNLVVDPNNLL